MPLVAPPRRNISACEQVQRISELISSQDENRNKLDNIEDDLVREEDTIDNIDETDLWLVKYDELASKSKTIPLSHLGCCKEGAELFSALCMWVDINQQYVELGLFPQWDDIARELNIDSMKTEWVRVCVRPEQSFTRAILEIYMNDGGTLGEVITALRKQKQYRIIQEISDQAEEFLDVYNTYHKTSYNPKQDTNPQIYSILNTLFECFTKTGQNDPLSKYQLYSGGFKSYLASLQDPANTKLRHNLDTDLIVNSLHVTGEAGGKLGQQRGQQESSQDSGYTSPRYGGWLPSLSETSDTRSITDLRSCKSPAPEKLDKNLVDDCEDNDDVSVITLRILLIFANDGATEADIIVTNLLNFSIPEFPNIKVDFFRLNEVELWNQLLLNPEACLVKWLDEMDYVMPIMTPQFLQVCNDFIHETNRIDFMFLGFAQSSFI